MDKARYGMVPHKRSDTKIIFETFKLLPDLGPRQDSSQDEGSLGIQDLRPEQIRTSGNAPSLEREAKCVTD